MVNINEAVVDCVSDEVGPDVDVFHAGVQLGVVCARDGSLVVTVQRHWVLLPESQFLEEGAQP